MSNKKKIKDEEEPKVEPSRITIKNPEVVLKLWATAARPPVKNVMPKGLDRPGEKDDRAWQAKCRVEYLLSNYHKARSVLWIAYVNRAIPTTNERTILDEFKTVLEESLRENPIVVILLDDVDGDRDPMLSIESAVAKLAEEGRTIARKTIERWCKDNLVLNYKEGRERLVRWREVEALAPRQKHGKKCA